MDSGTRAALNWNLVQLLKRKERANKCQMFIYWKGATVRSVNQTIDKLEEAIADENRAARSTVDTEKPKGGGLVETVQQLHDELERLREEQRSLEEATGSVKDELSRVRRPPAARGSAFRFGD